MASNFNLKKKLYIWLTLYFYWSVLIYEMLSKISSIQ